MKTLIREERVRKANRLLNAFLNATNMHDTAIQDIQKLNDAYAAQDISPQKYGARWKRFNNERKHFAEEASKLRKRLVRKLTAV